MRPIFDGNSCIWRLFLLAVLFQDVENRRIMTMQCSIKRNQDKKDTKDISIRILLRMEVTARRTSIWIKIWVKDANNLFVDTAQNEGKDYKGARKKIQRGGGGSRRSAAKKCMFFTQNKKKA